MTSNQQLEKAIRYRQSGEKMLAEACLDALLDLEPTHFEGLQQAGALKADLGKLDIAIDLLTRATQLAPKNPDALVNVASALHEAGRMQDCLDSLEAALHLNPDHKLAVMNKLHTLTAMERLDEAATLAASFIKAHPKNAEVHLVLADIEHRRSRSDLALLSLGEVLLHNPKHPEAQLKRAQIRAGLGQAKNALADLDRLLRLSPTHIDARLLRAKLLANAGRHKAALVDLDAAIAGHPKNPACYLQRGHCLLALGKSKAALEAFLSAAALDPNNVIAKYNAGTIALRLGCFDQAVGLFNVILDANPKHIPSRINRSTALRSLKQYDDALKDALYVFRHEPDNLDATFNCAVLYGDIRDYSRACFYYNLVIEADKTCIKALVARAMIFYQVGQYRKMLQDLNLALEIDPQHEEALKLRLKVHSSTKDFQGTVSDYQTLVARGLHQKYMDGDYLHAKMQMCDWDNLAKIYKRIRAGLDRNEPSATPFCIIPYTQSAAALRQCGKIYSQTEFGPKSDIDPIAPYPAKDKIRIAYFSADFYDHATMHLMAGLFENHDREKFETYAISFGPQPNDYMHKRAIEAFDHFIDASAMNEKTMALVARHFEIDIAIDLKGYTGHSRPNIFAYRAAPVQVNYLGYPGSMGADFIDYIIVDNVVVPEALAPHYSERVLHVPPSYQVNDAGRQRPDTLTSRRDHGLPQDAFVFCSFNNTYKIIPDIFSIWCDLLKEVEGSVLWLLADNPFAVRNLRRHAQERDVDPDRLIFAPRAVASEHLARHRHADLFLDSFPCNAHTTASDALFMGLPIITRQGETFASRVAASLLTAVGLPQLACDSHYAYRNKALEVARNRDELARLKKHLDGVKDMPLYDTVAFTRHFEALLEQIVKRPTA